VEIVNEYLGGRMLMPSNWEVFNEGTLDQQAFTCGPPGKCFVSVSSKMVEKQDATLGQGIKDEMDRRWDNPLLKRDVTLAGYPAYEVKAQNGKAIQWIFKFAVPEYSRLYELSLGVDEGLLASVAPQWEAFLAAFQPRAPKGRAGKGDQPWQFIPEEVAAAKTIDKLQFGEALFCTKNDDPHTPACSIQELATRMREDLGRREVVKVDADSLTNSQATSYIFEISGFVDDLVISAVPLRPDLGGFLFVQKDNSVHYHSQGPATLSDPSVPQEYLPSSNLRY
jgi:hypothetical protein